MQSNKLVELIKQCFQEMLEEEGGNTTGAVGGYLTKFAFKKSPKMKPLEESRYSQFKNKAKTRSPKEQLHIGIKEIQIKLDEINRLVDFATRMKTELKGDAVEIEFLKRTHNSLFKINEKIVQMNDKIKGLTT